MSIGIPTNYSHTRVVAAKWRLIEQSFLKSKVTKPIRGKLKRRCNNTYKEEYRLTLIKAKHPPAKGGSY